MPGSAPLDSPIPCPGCGYIADGSAGPVNFCPKCGMDLRGGAAPERTPANPWLGRVIADRYRLLALLGEGGMGAVYKAEHIRMGKALALKVLRGDFASDAGAVARFRSEAQIVSRLSHPHTIAVFDFGEIGEPEGFYLAMEYVPGKDLATALREGGPLPEARAASIGQQVLGSLAEAHDAGIVHRDMKPGNVMVTRTRSGEDFAKVLDFGIAKLRDEASGGGTGTFGSAAATSTGAIVGTPNYLSPEQARGEPPDARADLYSLGVVLYELVAGRPPFVAPNPMAVVNAHLHDPPPPLADVAPGVSPRYAEIVHRALEKKAADRWASADEMRDALLALDDAARPRPASGAARRPTVPEVTGELELANRDDFRDFERQLVALRRSRIAAPLAVAAVIAAAVAVVWRWDDVYALLARRWPAAAARLPAAVRPDDLYDGVEHEPNDSPAQANRLPLPPGPDGRRAGGVAVMRGHVGARLNDTTGDVDVFRIEVPPGLGRQVLVADWTADGSADGIRGLDVALTLNRDLPGVGGRAAPLVANVDRGGPGQPESLAVEVEPGTWWLAVREHHPAGAVPVEKPTDRYELQVRLRAPRPGEELEPDDAPDAGDGRAIRYPEWRALAERNPLAEGAPLHGTTSPEDPDTFAVVSRGAAAPTLVAAIPEPAVALAAERWVPDDVDRAAPRPGDRVRLEPAGSAPPGAVLLVPLPAAPREDAPDLVRLRAAKGDGAYDVVALGPGAASAAAVRALFDALAGRGQVAEALELAAGFARHLPGSPARDDVLLAGGALAARAAETMRAADLGRYRGVATLLGAEPFEAAGRLVRYRGAFEALVGRDGPRAEEAAFRLLPVGAPCTPAAVAARAAAFVARFPASDRVPAARAWEARAREDAFWRAGGRDRRALEGALDAWRRARDAGGDAADEAARRLAALGARRRTAQGAARVCR